MKIISFVFAASVASVATVLAGTASVSSKDTVATQPCPSWYADREWNISLWGTYAFTASDYPTLLNFQAKGYDTYLEADHAWGGGIDAKYFFARYFGIGVEGYALDVKQSFPDVNVNFFNINGNNFARTGHDRQAVGACMGTFTLRYPIRCSRFSPYLFGGGGAIFGGGQSSKIIAPPDAALSIRGGTQTKFIGQVGGGLEVRLTPHIGWINDFTWNVIDGPSNNFGMARTGINFAF